MFNEKSVFKFDTRSMCFETDKHCCSSFTCYLKENVILCQILLAPRQSFPFTAETINQILQRKPSKGLKAGFHQRRRRSRSRNQKGRAIRSSENQTDRVGSRTLSLLMSPLLTIKWKLHCRSRKQKRKNKPMTMFETGLCDWLVLPLLLPTPTT